MKKTLLFLLIALPVYIFISLYSLDKVYFLCPVEYQRGFIIRSDSRGDGVFAASRNGNRIHQGLDLLSEVGTPVLASRTGIVIASEQSRGMGKFIIIKHPQGITTLYGHLSEIYAAKNKFVRQGEVIGAVGKTGNANSSNIQPHLHLEVRKNGIHLDPLEYLQ